MNYRNSYNTRPPIVKPFQQIINASTNTAQDSGNNNDNNLDKSLDMAIERAVGTESTSRTSTPTSSAHPSASATGPRSSAEYNRSVNSARSNAQQGPQQNNQADYGPRDAGQYNDRAPQGQGAFQGQPQGDQMMPARGPKRRTQISRHKKADPTKRTVSNASDVQKAPESLHIPPVGENIRIIPLGGVEEIGMNMSLIEIGNDIIIIDAGFKFKDTDTPGIDYILPNTKYLEERKDKIRAIIITHGHLDHIGGLPFIMDRIGNPPLYTRNLTSLMIKKRQSEFPHLPPVDYRIVERDRESVKLGNISVRFFGVSHSIPDAMGVIVDTPYGMIVNPGDFKLDHRETVVTAEEEKNYDLFDGKNVLLFMGESTNIENPGFSTPDYIVHENLDEIIRATHGRLIMGMFASHFHRIAHVIMACEKYGKRLIIEGRSMKNNVDIAIAAGMLKIKPGTVISGAEIDQYPPDKIVVLATGAQGDEFAFLMRASTNSIKNFRLTDRDTLVLSSSIIPGNEKAVQKLKDNVARLGVKIIHYRTSDVYIHSTGHGNRGEIEWLHRKLRPKFFIPIHGHHYMLRLHAELAENLGVPKENVIVPDDGTIIEIQDGGTKLVRLSTKAPNNTVMVDGFTIGDIQDVVIRDRQILSQDGIFVVIALINASTGKLKKSPDIISRGSVYLRESQELLRETRYLVKSCIEQVTQGSHPINIDYVKDVVSESLGKFLFQQTAKKPIIIPVMICV
ncbi:MAG: ribonuclease J [bacterium]